jgi:Glyoxalase/Bleomycin resistance protein/Dioxygenase superfamily
MIVDVANINQAAYVVDDLDTAMEHWLKAAGCGPFFVIRKVSFEGFRYRGAPGSLVISVGMAQAGAIQIELIQQHSDGPSAYRDTFPNGGTGLHHIGLFTDEFDQEIERLRSLGSPLAHEAHFGDARGRVRFGYIDTRAAIGCMLEYVEDKPLIREICATVANAARDWDGSNPIRSFEPVAPDRHA